MEEQIMEKIKTDCLYLVYKPDTDNRGMSDHMLFYLNAYHSISHLDLEIIQEMIVSKVMDLLLLYNDSQNHDFMGCLFFELYFNTFQKLSKCEGSCKIFDVEYTPTKERDFIQLYHAFGIYWAKKTKLVNQYLLEGCDMIETPFVQLMQNIKQDIYDNSCPLLSWVHNHYGYFSTMFFTQTEPYELRINKRIYCEYIRNSLDHAIDTDYSVDYIGECIEYLLRQDKYVDEEHILYLLNHKPKGNSYHYLVTGSIAPLALLFV